MNDTNCLFCKIIEGEIPADIVHQDNEIIIFKDIHPAASHHYLICPKHHIRNGKELTILHKPLVERLYRAGKEKLSEFGIDEKNARFGFHWPPFNSVQHLHLHAIGPILEMSFISRLIFRLNSYWFVTPEYVLKKISEDVNHCNQLN